MPKKERKKFKDTKLGQFLKEKAPGLLHKVAEFLPDNGIPGIIKNIIDKEPEVKAEVESMSIEDRIAFEKLQQDFYLEVHKLETEDRASARNREIEYVKAGRIDWMFLATGIVALLCFVLMVMSIIFYPKHIENSHHFSQLMGIIEGVTMSLFVYYFGSTQSSREKTKMMIDKEK